MANAYRSGPGHILIGFKDCTPHPAEVVEIAAIDHIDDADLQQLVRSKIDPVLEFQYEERLFDGKHIAIFAIPLQVRPFAPKQDFEETRGAGPSWQLDGRREHSRGREDDLGRRGRVQNRPGRTPRRGRGQHATAESLGRGLSGSWGAARL